MRQDIVQHAEDAILLYAAVARLLLPPDAETELLVKSEDLSRTMQAASRRVGDAQLVAAIDAFAVEVQHRRDGSAEDDTLFDSHARAFGHCLSPTHPPYETQYGEDQVFRQPQRLADVRGFYRAFGVVVPEDAHERADQLGVELEFVALLTAREATAAAHGDEESAQICSSALERFLCDHIGAVLPTFRRLLKKHTDGSFYPTVAQIAEALCAWDCRRRGVSPAVEERSRLVKFVEPDPDMFQERPQP